MAKASPISATFERFFESERSAAAVLVLCTAVSMALANFSLGPAYAEVWHVEIAGLSLAHWVNDGSMAVFFLLIGLELERELYIGELSDFRNALLPIVAAAGGAILPALIHFSLNGSTATVRGAGIPVATDIAFALGVLALVGTSVPASLKIFLTAIAVADDLFAIVVIAVFYTADLSLAYLGGALGVFALLFLLNRLRVMALLPYVGGGLLLWFLILRSGVHATVAGVLLAFAIPFTSTAEDARSPSHRLEHLIQRPVAFVVLPAFALANTAIVVGRGAISDVASLNGLGIMAGLLLGKPLGIALLSFVAVRTGICRLPTDLSWRHVVGAGLLAGIGFTMSIFITNLAFVGDSALISSSKLAIIVASTLSGTVGYIWLRWSSSRRPHLAERDG